MKNKKQQEALRVLLYDCKVKYLMYGGAAGGAKSWTGCLWLLIAANAYPGTRWFIGREELKRLRQSTYITWLKVCKTEGFRDFTTNFQDNFIQLGNGGSVYIKGRNYR